jgi:GNAT superfamily N-acetyltransferase
VSQELHRRNFTLTSGFAPMKIILAETDSAIVRCFPVMKHLRPHLTTADDFLARIRRMQRENFYLAFVEEAESVRAVAGYRFIENLVAGKNLYVDDLVTDPAQRSRGHGRALLTWLAEQARTHGCKTLELDSGVQRADAHRFYFRERMHISAYHFVRAL